MQALEDFDAHCGHVQHKPSKELEGTDDSQNFYSKKQHVLAIRGLLGLGQLKGCDVDESAVPSAFFSLQFCLVLR